jgi:hypothetical protein
MADVRVGVGKRAKTKRAARSGVSGKGRAKDSGARAAAGKGTEPEKPVRGNGVERLKKAANMQVARKSSELAELLMNKALEGKLDSARLLVTLAEKKKPPEKPVKKRHGPTLLDLLESEPERVEPEVGDVWVGNGWKKQGTGEIVREGETREEAAE